jgi:hypothetical protein
LGKAPQGDPTNSWSKLDENQMLVAEFSCSHPAYRKGACLILKQDGRLDDKKVQKKHGSSY